MIDVKCKDDDSKTEEKNIYPCLKICRNSGRIVLFVAPKDGYQLSCETEACDLLHHSTMWTEDLYTLYPGTIELKNA